MFYYFLYLFHYCLIFILISYINLLFKTIISILIHIVFVWIEEVKFNIIFFFVWNLDSLSFKKIVSRINFVNIFFCTCMFLLPTVISFTDFFRNEFHFFPIVSFFPSFFFCAFFISFFIFFIRVFMKIFNVLLLFHVILML